MSVNARFLVELLGDSTKLRNEFNKAASLADSTGKRIESSFKSAAAGLVAGFTLGALAAEFNSLVGQAARFQDLAEKTGANAEALASFSIAAKVADVDIEGVADASVKLSKNLNGVDDDSKAAGAALTALGIPIKEFKALDPAKQIEEVARAMAGFEDGSNKVAVSLALFGKSGAQLLPFFKELASGAGRQTILNDQLIKQADEYADRQARARAELNAYAQVAVSQALPALTDLTDATKDLIKELIGVDRETKNLRDSHAVDDFATNAVEALGFVASAGQGAARSFKFVADTIIVGVAQTAALGTGNIKEVIRLGEEWKARTSAALETPLFSRMLAERIAARKESDALRNREDRGFRPAGRQIDFSGAQKGGGKAQAEKTSEAQRYLDTLQKQLEKSYELSAVEQLLVEIQIKGLKGLNPELSAKLFATAEQIDANKALEKSIEASRKTFEEEVHAVKEAAKARSDAAKQALDDAEHALQANEQLRDEIAIIIGGEHARKALEKDYLRRAIARKEDALAAAQQTKGMEGVAAALQIEVDALRERGELLAGKDIAEQLRKEADALQEVANTLTDSFADAFEGFVMGTKSAKDAFKDFATDIERYLVKLALHKIGDAIFGGNTAQGPDFFSLLGKFLGSMGGSSAGASAASIGNMGADFVVPGFAGGTRDAPGGLAWVGERGKELVYLPPHSRVQSHEDSMRSPHNGQVGYGREIHYFHFPEGTSRATADQQAAKTLRQLQSGRRVL
ncbi:MAG: hypothetical protein WC809_18835 [Sinimarinibacterium sp.]|jgi:acetolactate synthase regulatory subunit